MTKSIKTYSRLSGLLYLALILTGFFSLVYVPTQLITWGDSIETLNSISGNELLFRLGVIGDIVMYLTFMFLSLALYKLLEHVNRSVAVIMVILVLVSVAVSFMNLIPKLDALSILNEAGSLAANDGRMQADKLLFLLRSHSNGISVLQIFWGLWLFPFGYLVLKSNFLPGFLGVILMIGCFGYLTEFLGSFLFLESYGETVIPTLATIPHALGEIGICLWLLIVGVKEKADKNEL